MTTRDTGAKRVPITLTAGTWYWLIRTGDCPPALYKAVPSRIKQADDTPVTIELSPASAIWVRQNTKGGKA